MQLNRSTEILLENFFMLPIILLEESEIMGALSHQLRIRAMKGEIQSFIERNQNSLIEIHVENEEHFLSIKNQVLADSRTRVFRITISRTWNDFKIEQLSESHENLFVSLKTFKI
jgi:hypothetical protein